MGSIVKSLLPIAVAGGEIPQVPQRRHQIHAQAQDTDGSGGQHHPRGFPPSSGISGHEDPGGCQGCLQAYADPKRGVMEDREVNKKQWITYFFKQSEQVNPSHGTARSQRVIFAPGRPVLLLNAPPLVACWSAFPTARK